MPVLDPDGREVLGLSNAADCANVTHQTVSNWARDGVIHEGTDAITLAELNHRKTGRKHQRYFYRDELEKVAYLLPGPDLISIEDAAKQLGTDTRTLNRIKVRQRLETLLGPGRVTYFRREDIDKQIEGVTYSASEGLAGDLPPDEADVPEKLPERDKIPS